MIRAIGWLAMLGAVAVSSWFANDLLHRQAVPATASVRHIHQPTIDLAQVRQLAALVTLEAPISDVQVTEIEGLTGGIRMVIAVHGDVQIATSLKQARFAEVDQANRSALIVLPKPEPIRPRLDHDKTRVVEIERSGLWRMLMGQAGESALTNRAMARAQHVLVEAAHDPELVKRGCAHTEQVIRQFFAAMDWDVAVQWAADESNPDTEKGNQVSGAR